MSVIDEPIAAIAAGRCVLARSLATMGRPPTPQHPRRCAWCDYPLADLSRMVEGWNHWADGKDRGQATVYARHDAQLFAERSRKHPAEAEALIVAAQGLEPLSVPQPMDVQPEPAPLEPTDTEEDVSAWM